MKTPRNRRRGLTMIEVLIASIILTAIVGMASYLVWSSSNTVSAAEVGVQLDQQCRLILAQIETDLRQCKAQYIRDISTADGINPGAGAIPTASQGFSGIQLRLPGAGYDVPAITGTGAGNWLKNYKANAGTYTTRLVRYYWAADAGEGEKMNGLDDNNDGRVDEGVLMKLDAITDANGNILSSSVEPLSGRTVTNETIARPICRDLRPCYLATAIVNPPIPANTPATQLSPCNWGIQFSVNQWPNPTKVTVTLTLEKMDPKARRSLTVHTIQKQVSTVVELRN